MAKAAATVGRDKAKAWEYHGQRFPHTVIARELGIHRQTVASVDNREASVEWHPAINP